MKIKTSELIGPALNWAVSKCEGYNADALLEIALRAFNSPPGKFLTQYSADWSEGGPIIEREQIAIVPCGDHWNAAADDQTLKVFPWEGPTPLIAAMRCFVASRLGDEVEIPEELK